METLAPLFGYPATPGAKERGGTSEQAARGVARKAKTIKARVLAALQELPGGLTADELARRMREDFANVRPRLSELLVEGKVTKTEKRGLSRTGASAIVYRAVRPCS